MAKQAPVRKVVSRLGGEKRNGSRRPSTNRRSPSAAGGQADTKRQLKIQKALYEIADAASAVKDMQSFYKKLHKIVGKLMYAENFFIALYDEQARMIHWDYVVDEKDQGKSFWQPQPLDDENKTGTAYVIRSGKMIRGRDLDKLMAEGAFEVTGARNVDVIGLPLKNGRKILGALALQSYKRDIVYSEQDAEVLQFVAQHIATALTRARAIEAERQRTDELAILNSVGEAMAKTLDVKTVVKIVGDKVQSIFSAEAVTIRLYDPATDLIQRAYDFDVVDGYTDLSDTVFPLGKGLTTLIIESSMPLSFGSWEEGKALGAILTPTNSTNNDPRPEAFIGAPIFGGDKVIGTVSVQSYKQNTYNENHLRLLQTLASNMGVAIQNARLFEAEQERVAELQIINSIQQGLAAELDFQAIVDLVGDKLSEVLKTGDLDIRWYDEKTNLMHFLYTFEHGERLTIAPIPPTKGGVFETILKDRQPIVLNTRDDYVKFKTLTIPGTDQSKSCIYIPIISGDRVLGLIVIENYERENAFGESELRLLTTIAASLGTALENARLFDETQHLFKAEQERVAELAVINSVQEGLASKLEYTDIIDLVGDKLYEIFKPDILNIAIYHPATNRTSYPYAIGLGTKRHDLPESDVAGFTGEAIRKRQTIVVNEDLERRMAEAGSYNMVKEGPDPQSLVYVPIVAGDEVLGVVSMQSFERGHVFPDSDVRLMETLTSSMSVALQNARSFKAEQERVAELAVINSVQQALAAKLDMQGIYNTVGEKLREIFSAQAIIIYSGNLKTRTETMEYAFEKGQQLERITEPLNSMYEYILGLNKTFVRNKDFPQFAAQFKDYAIPQGEMPISVMDTPVIRNEGDGFYLYVSIMDMDGEKTFDESDVRLLETLANSMSVALENARLFKAEQERVAELAVINSVQTALGSQLDFNSIVDAVGDKLAEIFSGENVGIGFLDKNTQVIHVPYIFENGKRIANVEFPIGDRGLMSHVVKTLQPLVINTDFDRRNEELGGISVSDAPNPKSWLGVPILLNGEYIGGFSLQNWDHENAYTESHVRLLQTLAGSLGVALENARLFKAEQERVAELQIINSIQQGLAAELDFQAIVDLVGDKLREILSTGNLSINWYVEKDNLVHYLYTYEHGKRLEVLPMPPTPGGQFETMRQTRQPIVANTPADFEMLNIPTVPGTDTSRSLITVPIISSDRVLGAMQIENHDRENAFGEAELRLLTTIAASLGTALENARLFDETQRLFKAEQERVAELQIINSIQQGLAAELDFQAIVDLVGDKLREVFTTPDLMITWYDEKSKLVNYLYVYEHGNRLEIPARPPNPGGIYETEMKTRQPVVWNTQAEYTSLPIPGTDRSKSAIYVPIISSDRFLGDISIENYERENAFGESELRLLTTIAASLGTALENARLFDETQQRNAELAIINNVQASLAAKLEMQAIYDAVGDKIQEIFDAQVVMIVTHDKANDLTQFSYAIEKGERLHIDSRPVAGITGHVIRTGQTVLINQNLAQKEIEILGTPSIIPAGEDIKSRLDVPMIVGGEVRGVISLQNVDRENAFSESDLRLLTTLANSMSVALENARLFDETQRLLKETEQRAAELALINGVQQGLASKLDIQAIIDLVGEKIRDVFDTQITYIALHNKASQTFRIPYYLHQGNRVMVEGNHPTDRGPTGHIIKRRETLVFNHDANELITQLGAISVAEDDKPRSWLGVPMIAGDEVVGVISLQNIEREHAYSETDVSLLKTIASSLAVALQNAQLFEETNRLLKVTEDRAAELAIINSVQEGLASKLDMQAIYDLVGDKIQSMFNAQSLIICSFDHDKQSTTVPYAFENSERIFDDDIMAFSPLHRHLIETRQPVVINENSREQSKRYGLVTIEGTQQPKSLIYVPFGTGTQVNGYFSLQNMEREHAFAESDVRLLQTLAGSMGIALENARLFNAEQQRAAELAVINSIQQGLAAELDFQNIIDLVGDKLREVLNTGEIGIRWYDAKANLIHYLYEYEHNERITIPSAPPSNRIWETLVLTRKPFILNSTADSVALGVKAVPGTDQSKSAVYIPIVGSDRVLGTIVTENYERENAYTEADVRLLSTVASSMGVALENARLFDETQRLLKETEQRAAELGIINSVQDGLAKELDYQAIIELVGEKVREIFQSNNMSIRLYDHATGILSYPYIIDNGVVDHIEPQPLGKGLTAHIIQTRQTLVINQDLEKRMEELGSRWIGSLTTDNDKSFAGVPILAGDKAIGTIILGSKQENVFGDSDVRLLQTLAGSLGVSLENARLFNETQRLLKETEQRAAELQIINSVQAGLAQNLDIQAIYEIVGEKVREIFDAQAVVLKGYDKDYSTVITHYLSEKGERFYPETTPMSDLHQHLIRNRKTLVFNENAPEELTNLGATIAPGTETARSAVFVPLLAGNHVFGTISLQNVDHENAFSDSDVRLLQTLANSMSVALENARLFDETQRLLKETEQRAAELAIINSVQQGLASKLDMQAIYDLIGNKICEIFSLQTCYIMVYDKEKNLEHYPFLVDNGKRIVQEDLAHDENGFGPLVMKTRQPIMINEDMDTRSKEVNSYDLSNDGDPVKAALYVPLLIGDEAKGVISVQNTQREQAYTDSDLRLVTTLASSMSVALESARLFAETEQRAAELAIINSVQEGLASKLDVKAIYELVGEKLRELFEHQAISLITFDEGADVSHYQYFFEKGKRLQVADAPITKLGKHIIHTRQTLLINDHLVENLAKIGVSLKILAGTETPKSMLRVPILIGGKVHGLIGLSNLDRENAFSAADVRLLTTLASSLSVALESARLFEETKRNAAELATINTVSSALASELDIDPLIQLVGEQARTIFRADIAYVALLDDSGETINFPYTYGEELPPLYFGEGLTSKIIETGKPLLINENVDREIEDIGATLVGVVAESYLGVPIFVSGRAVGVVSVQSTSQRGVFTESDERLLSTIASSVGTALHNAQLYKEAQGSRAAAEQANKAKSTFLANMSHELRTPLNAIIGFTRIVRKKADGALPVKQLENLDKVLTSSEHLLGLINTVLDIAKIEAGRMDVTASNFSIGALADQCANLTAPLLKPKVKLEKQVDETLGIIHSDQDKIKQIVINLLSNAAKFTHEGKITLSVQKSSEASLSISVADTGIGISEEALGRIFEEFQQADTSTTRQYGGSGLGLAISRNLARLLGGDLTAVSEPGKGSTFTLTIPIHAGKRTTPLSDASTLPAVVSTSLKPVSVQTTEHQPLTDYAKKRVLVIDDDPDAAYILQESLNQNEFAVIGSRNGYEGLQMARDGQPDAILLDILMPDVDGWQVLNDLKSDAATIDIPVILLTIVDKKALGFKLGAAAYLLKPLDPVVVLDALHRVIGEKGHAYRHVLVVDDDPHVAEMLRQTLPESDFRLDSAEDGEAGLQAIETFRPDVILLDLMMPKLDGFGVIERLRSDPELRNIPIIVISAKELTEAESKTLKESVAFVMRKQGFDGDLLMEEINSVLKK